MSSQRTSRAGLAAVAAAALAVGSVSAATAATAAGSSSPAGASVTATPVTTVANGRTAQVRVTLTRATTRATTVRWTTGGAVAKGAAAAARAGTDYAPASGTVRFPAGARAGSTRTIAVPTRHVAGAAEAKAIPLRLTATGARLAGAQPTVVVDAHGLPYLDASLPVKTRVEDLLKRMTLEEKVGQMTQAERASIDAERTQITGYELGSILSGGGSTPAVNDPTGWADMVDAYQSYALQTRLQIPMVYGVDSVHGHGNLVGSTIFPHDIGLGSTRDPALVRQVESVVADETRATGIPWAFAPCLCVARDDRWGRTYESFGEDPSLVIAMETAIDGLQGTSTKDLASHAHVLATAKHFAGDGDTTYGSGLDSAGANASNYPIDQGITQQSRAHVRKVDLAPYVPAVQQHHVGTVMPSYSSIDYTDDGLGNPVKMHADKALLQRWLKDKIGFDGFVISDYNGIDKIPLATNAERVAAWVNAGGDMAMVPSSYVAFEHDLVTDVLAGAVKRSRIDDAVSRILTKKFQLGLFEHPYADRTDIGAIGDAQHRGVARQAAAESQVLLKNDGVLPLAKDAKVYVAGRNADDVGNQMGGWTVSWQGGSGTHTTGATSILAGMRQVAPGADITYSEDGSAPATGADVGVVVVGETPYSEGFGDVGNTNTWGYDPWDNGVQREVKKMELQDGDAAVVDKVCAAVPKCVVLVVSGRPQVIGDRLGSVDAMVASWLPGSEGEGVADVLFGDRPFTGQLSQTWPRSGDQEPINVGDRSYDPLFPFGWGLQTVAHPGTATAGTSPLSRARAYAGGGHLSGSAAHAVVTALRLYVQDRVADPASGVPAKASDAIARADVASLKGDDRTAVRLLLGAL